ncbi:hypothetical protein DPMN_089436 [Dreissena polymorpha]|uniref:Uncharacterized protein n=1 Tax=Dreissena polymorpha TaxID=45954 RepID=A0A9D4KYA0_DREPO|nr:hypothetical protein DPMN_089436 [Dreissena polymorpha]
MHPFSTRIFQTDLTNPFCKPVDDVCFLPDQTLYLDNCWLTVAKSELDTATAMVEVSAFNQAMLSTTTSFNVCIKLIKFYNGIL